MLDPQVPKHRGGTGYTEPTHTDLNLNSLFYHAVGRRREVAFFVLLPGTDITNRIPKATISLPTHVDQHLPTGMEDVETIGLDETSRVVIQVCRPPGFLSPPAPLPSSSA